MEINGKEPPIGWGGFLSTAGARARARARARAGLEPGLGYSLQKSFFGHFLSPLKIQMYSVINKKEEFFWQKNDQIRDPKKSPIPPGEHTGGHETAAERQRRGSEPTAHFTNYFPLFCERKSGKKGN